MIIFESNAISTRYAENLLHVLTEILNHGLYIFRRSFLSSLILYLFLCLIEFLIQCLSLEVDSETFHHAFESFRQEVTTLLFELF